MSEFLESAPGCPVAMLSRRLAQGSLSVRDLVQTCLDRIRARDPLLRAWVAVDADGALREAADRDRAWAGGQGRSPLHGIPIGLKDLVQVTGWPTGFGSAVWPGVGAPATTSAASVVRLQAAGMILLGRTELPEFAFGSWGTNAVRGTPRNPADAEVARVPGGSSSGAAVAVADGMVPIALGSDTGGSIRIPASQCGVVGFKPSRGTIPMEGVLPLCPSLDTVGPIARTVADAALVMDALEGRPPHLRAFRPYRVEGLRIGIVAEDQWGDTDAAVSAAVAAAVDRLEALGAVVLGYRLPRDCATYQHRTGLIMAAEAVERLGPMLDAAPPDRTDPHVRARVLAGRAISPDSLAQVRAERMSDLRALPALFAGVDCLLLPTTPITARPIAVVDESIIPLSRLTRFVNWFDLTALSVPFGTDADGLPIGLQVAGPAAFREAILDVAQALEAAQSL